MTEIERKIALKRLKVGKVFINSQNGQRVRVTEVKDLTVVFNAYQKSSPKIKAIPVSGEISKETFLKYISPDFDGNCTLREIL